MNKIEYDTEMSDACGDADKMLSACIKRIQYLNELLVKCDDILVAHGYDPNEGIRKEVENELGYT